MLSAPACVHRIRDCFSRCPPPLCELLALPDLSDRDRLILIGHLKGLTFRSIAEWIGLRPGPTWKRWLKVKGVIQAHARTPHGQWFFCYLDDISRSRRPSRRR